MKTKNHTKAVKSAWMLLVILAGSLATGCNAVKPWQRGQLADPIMRPDRDPLGLALAEHV